MPPQNAASLVRLGIWALPLGALLGLIGNLSSLSIPDPDNDPTGAAHATTTGYFLIQFIANVLSPALAIFGIFALFAYLLHTHGGRLASSAMVLSILGLSMLLSFGGIITYAIPALAQEYLNGQQSAIQMTNALFNAEVFAVVIVGGLLIFLGFVLFGVALWRLETLPKWAGVVLALAGLLLAVPGQVPALLGTLLVVIAGVWIALDV